MPAKPQAFPLVYLKTKGWPDDVRMLTEWQIREFLGYVANETCRWGLEGNGSETSKGRVSHTTIHHYFVVLANWLKNSAFIDAYFLAYCKLPA